MTTAPRTPRGPARFTEADVRRAIRGAMKARISIAAVEIAPDGVIRVIPSAPAPVAVSAPNPLDNL